MASRGFIHKQFEDHFACKPTGVLMAKLKNEAGFINVGNYESVTWTPTVEREDIWSPQTPERSKIATIVTEQSVTMSFELAQLTPMFRAIAFQSRPDLLLDQEAVIAQDIEIVDAKAGRIFPTGFRKISNVMVTDATAAEYVEDTHFQYDAETGNVEILAHPGDVEKATITITVDAAAITGRTVWGLLSETEIRGSLMFRSTNKYGPLSLVELWDVEFAADGDQTLGSNTTDKASFSFTATVFADDSQADAFKYGKITDIPRAAA